MSGVLYGAGTRAKGVWLGLLCPRGSSCQHETAEHGKGAPGAGSGREGAKILEKAVVPNLEEFFERVFDDLLEIVGRAAGAVLVSCGYGKRAQRSWPPRLRREGERSSGRSPQAG